MGSERERTESVEESESAEIGERTSVDDDSGIDSALEIEAALSDLPGASADIDDEEATGRVTEVQQIPATEVPDSYPISMDSEQAIAFRVDIDFERETTVYLAWPDTYDESADLACLLNELDLSPDRFADVLGEEINLVVVDGQWVPEVAAESARPHPQTRAAETLPDPPGTDRTMADGPEVVMNDGTAAVIEDENGTRVVEAEELDKHLQSGGSSAARRRRTAEVETETTEDVSEYYYYGVLGMTAFWGGFVLEALSGLPLLPLPGVVTALLLLVSPVVFPYLVYKDSQYVDQESDWSPHIGWALGTIFWILNLLTAGAYLIKRRENMTKDQ